MLRRNESYGPVCAFPRWWHVLVQRNDYIIFTGKVLPSAHDTSVTVWDESKLLIGLSFSSGEYRGGIIGEILQNI